MAFSMALLRPVTDSSRHMHSFEVRPLAESTKTLTWHGHKKETEKKTDAHRNFLFAMTTRATSTIKFCKQDYDCNAGGWNFPLKCVKFVVVMICVELHDDFQGGQGVLHYAMEPVPVMVNDVFS